MTDEQAIINRPKNWCRQFARKVGPRANSVRYSSFRLLFSRSTRERECHKLKRIYIKILVGWKSHYSDLFICVMYLLLWSVFYEQIYNIMHLTKLCLIIM